MSLLELFLQAFQRIPRDADDRCCRFEDQAADALSNTLAEAAETISSSFPVGLVGKAGDAVEEVVGKSLWKSVGIEREKGEGEEKVPLQQL